MKQNILVLPKEPLQFYLENYSRMKLRSYNIELSSVLVYQIMTLSAQVQKIKTKP